MPFDQRLSFVDPSQQHVTEIERPDDVVDFFEADAIWAFKAVDTYSKRVLKRMVPAWVTRFTMKWCGYASVGSTPV